MYRKSKTYSTSSHLTRENVVSLRTYNCVLDHTKQTYKVVRRPNFVDALLGFFAARAKVYKLYGNSQQY